MENAVGIGKNTFFVLSVQSIDGGAPKLSRRTNDQKRVGFKKDGYFICP